MKAGHTTAVYKSRDPAPLSREVWKRVVRGAASMWASSFSTLGGIPSGPSLPFTFSMILNVLSQAQENNTLDKAIESVAGMSLGMMYACDVV